MAGDDLRLDSDPNGSPYASGQQLAADPFEGRQVVTYVALGPPYPDQLGTNDGIQPGPLAPYIRRLEHLRGDRQQVQRLLDSVTLDLRSAVEEAVADGMTESAAARHAGVTRQTIRSWLGKTV